MSENKQLERWAEGVGSEDDAERGESAKAALSALTTPAFKSKKALLTLLQSSWWPLNPELIPEAVSAVLSTARGLELDDPEVEDAALLLGNLCREDASQVEALKSALADPSPALRRTAAGAAGRIGEAALGLLPALIQCLSAKEEEVGSAAVESLSALGSLAPEAVAPALLKDVARATGARRYLGLAGLRGMIEEQYRAGQPLRGLDTLESAVLPSLTDEQPAMRLEAAGLIGMVKPATEEGNAALTTALSDGTPEVAAYAAVGLLRRGAQNERALATLSALVMSEDPEKNGAALTVLDGLEPSVLKRARPMLEEAVRSGPEAVRPLARELIALLDVQQLRGGRPV